MNLLLDAITKFILGIIIVGLLLFIPAGSLLYKNGITFMCVLFIPMFIAGIIMYLKAPDLLRSRLNVSERQNTQKEVIKYSGLMFIASFIIAGLNYRYGWISFPNYIVISGIILFLLSYLLFAIVLKENAYLSRTIEVKENQKVIDNGLYGIVRHPMYTASIFLFLSMPLVLNSPISFIVMLIYIPLILKRIKNEEELLEKQLNGYIEYKQKVKYKLLPYIY